MHAAPDPAPPPFSSLFVVRGRLAAADTHPATAFRLPGASKPLVSWPVLEAADARAFAARAWLTKVPGFDKLDDELAVPASRLTFRCTARLTDAAWRAAAAAGELEAALVAAWRAAWAARHTHDLQCDAVVAAAAAEIAARRGKPGCDVCGRTKEQLGGICLDFDHIEPGHQGRQCRGAAGNGAV
jgi:hypothetical protein